MKSGVLTTWRDVYGFRGGSLVMRPPCRLSFKNHAPMKEGNHAGRHNRVPEELKPDNATARSGFLVCQLPVTTPRRTWRRADVVAHRPSALFHFIPAPHA